MIEVNFSTFGMVEAIHEGMSTIAVEAVTSLEYIEGSSEILETATGSSQYQVIQEAVLEAAGEMIHKFLQQCEKVARAIANRLKEFSAGLMSKTTEWVHAVQPRVDAAKQHQGWQSLRADIYPWNPVYLESGISNGIRKLHMTWNSAVVGNSYVESILREVRSKGVNSEGFLQSTINELTENLETINDDVVYDAAQAFSVSASSMEGIWEGITIKAHGGAREPGYTFGVDIDKIIATLVNSSKIVDNVTQTYEIHAKDLHDFKDTMRSELIQISDIVRTSEGGTTLIDQAVKVVQQYTIRATEKYESIMSRANSLCVSMIQQMVAEYMRCVNMFASYKGPVAQR